MLKVLPRSVLAHRCFTSTTQPPNSAATLTLTSASTQTPSISTDNNSSSSTSNIVKAQHSVIPLASNSIPATSGIFFGTRADRSIRIFQSCRNAMQSGNAPRSWRIEFNTASKWENPLMGWTSSADPWQALSLKFDTKEAAIAWAEGGGWNWTVEQEPAKESWKVKSYADNFAYSPNKLKMIKTK